MRFKVLKFNINRLASYYFSVLTLAKHSFQIDDITYMHTSHECSPGLSHKIMAFNLVKQSNQAVIEQVFIGKESFKL